MAHPIRSGSLLSLILGIVYICASSTSCTKHLTPQEAFGKTLLLPNRLSLVNSDSDVLTMDGYKMIVFIDSASCFGCELKSYHWTDLLNSFSNCDSTVHVCAIIQTQNSKIAREICKRDRIMFPVYHDKDGIFSTLNNFSNNKALHYLLVDRQMHIALVGDPISNKKILQLYDSLLKFHKNSSYTTIRLSANCEPFDWRNELKIRRYIHNDTDSVLSIDSIHTSCECTTATIDKTEIPPQDSATVCVTYKADAPGHFMREIYLDANGQSAFYTLVIEGDATE